MDMATIYGALVSGFATRLYGAGAAIWIAIEVIEPFIDAMSTVSQTLSTVAAVG